jgi:hypothetical protein
MADAAAEPLPTPEELQEGAPRVEEQAGATVAAKEAQEEEAGAEQGGHVDVAKKEKLRAIFGDSDDDEDEVAPAPAKEKKVPTAARPLRREPCDVYSL